MPNIRWLLALITSIHRFLYRVTGGRLGKRMAGNDMLLLSTVGRKTGQTRVTPLLTLARGDHFLVVASNAGDDREPAWWLNLKNKPEARVQFGTEHCDVHARAAEPQEAEALWPQLIEAYAAYAEYRHKTSREIPIVVLERRG